MIGSALHWGLGSNSLPILFQLLLGGEPGVVLGCLFAPKVPANKPEELMRLVHSLRVQGLLVQAIYVARLVRETGGPLRP